MTPASPVQPEAWAHPLISEGRGDHFIHEDPSRGINGCELRLFFGTEVGKQKAFAHPERFGEASDCQALIDLLLPQCLPRISEYLVVCGEHEWRFP